MTPGEIAGETFRKVFKEAGFEHSMHEIHHLFDPELRERDDVFRLRNLQMNEAAFLQEIASGFGVDVSTLRQLPEMDFLTNWTISGKTAYEICTTSRSSFSYTDSFGNALSPDEEARRLALAQLFVLTQGQDVPAIYFNDLPGLENDLKLFEITGKPRDLNRHKNRLDEMIKMMNEDPFTKAYIVRLNAILKLRSEDGAFYPGSRNFEFRALNDQVFMNHPWHGGNHSLILGNIVNRKIDVELDSSLMGDYSPDQDCRSPDRRHFAPDQRKVRYHLEPYGCRWLKDT